MIGLTSHHSYYLYKEVCDMRKGFDGLSGLVKQEMNRNPVDGNIYLFINRRRDRMKMLVWESGGFMLYYKRLEKGTFELPELNNSNQKKLSWETLVLMLTGISLIQKGRKKRYNFATESI